MSDIIFENGLTKEENAAVMNMLEQMPDKLVLSNLSDRSYLYKKTVIKKFYRKDSMLYQVERFTDKQAFHENIGYDELSAVIFSVFPKYYKQLNSFSEKSDWDYKVTKKGRLLSNCRKTSGEYDYRKETYGASVIPDSKRSHNRRKNYILQEGMVIPPLIDLGIFTKDGRVVHAMYDKYKQINRFVELVDDVIKNHQELNIIDFGCGKSYLTFILYYYLVELKGLNVTMTGLDLKADVIEKCNATAKKYHYDKLHFELGDINGYKADKPVDMVITLHACDTATDYALYNAICWNAEIIMSVPCCQHELNARIQSPDYSILTRYGIVKERISALMTDSIRANMLEYCGYNTQLLEFIDIEHSPKNILIRAVKKHGRRIGYNGSVASQTSDNRPDKQMEAWNEAERLCEEFHLKQTLMELVRGTGV